MARQQQRQLKVAEKNYEASDYHKVGELESGLAVTHEQASDSLTEGTIDGRIENVQGENVHINNREIPKTRDHS